MKNSKVILATLVLTFFVSGISCTNDSNQQLDDATYQIDKDKIVRPGTQGIDKDSIIRPGQQ